MSKKLLIGLAPLVVIASFVMMPAAAQALAPHWYVDGTRATEGEKVPVIAWGQLTLSPEPEGVAAPTTCLNAAGGYLENPVGDGAGKGLTERFATWDCQNTECPQPNTGVEFEVVSPPQFLGGAATSPSGSNGGWPSELIGVGPNFKLNSTKVVVELGCFVHPAYGSTTKGPVGSPGENELKEAVAGTTVKCETNATHLQDPQAAGTGITGTNKGNNQSKLVFNQPAGSGLTCAGGAITGRNTQNLKTMGYNASELITAVNSP